MHHINLSFGFLDLIQFSVDSQQLLCLGLFDLIELSVHLQQFFLGEGHIPHAQHTSKAKYCKTTDHVHNTAVHFRVFRFFLKYNGNEFECEDDYFVYSWLDDVNYKTNNQNDYTNFINGLVNMKNLSLDEKKIIYEDLVLDSSKILKKVRK